jgi:hypothetical protein
MPKNYPPGHCPDQCNGGHADRQMNVEQALLKQFPEQARQAITTHGRAKRCTYCGLVYLSPANPVLGRLGYWDSGVRGQGWTT